MKKNHEPKTPRQIFEIPAKLEKAIETALSEYSLTFHDSKKIADAILRMSDFYISTPSIPTPWSEKWCQIAQLCYFLPLNYLRSLRVAHEAQLQNFPIAGQTLVDFGSGLGAGSLPWSQKFQTPIQIMETSSEAQRLHQKILEYLGEPSAVRAKDSELRHPKNTSKHPAKNFSALFSYALTELKELPDWAYQAQNLILIEPSTQRDGRNLMEQRKQLIEKGFSIWAPCTHQLTCPLLEKSKNDWCHDRLHLKMPDWYLEIEKHLPMKNATLTHSYLLASKTPAPANNQWRLVGDRVDEKGKTRQLVCRGPEREFLAWLHRDGEPPDHPRGILLSPLEKFEIKSNEIRVPGS